MCHRPQHQAGITVVKLAIILAVAGIMVGVASLSSRQWADNQRLSTSARIVAGAFSQARGEAVRTGNIHAVFVATDADANPLSSPVLVLNDGRPGILTQNCNIDGGEATSGFSLETGVGFGVARASAKVVTDPGGGSLGMSTFQDAEGDPASWVLFRPEGAPLAFSDDCALGAVGSGGGAIYLTNGERDMAVVLTPLGSTRIHSWDAGSGSWTQ